MIDRKTVASVLVALALAGCAGKTKQKHFENGEAYFAQGKFAEAAIEYTNALKQTPGDAKALRGLGLALFEVGDYPRSVGTLEQARKLGPPDARLLVKLGIAQHLQGRAAEARQIAREALALDPKSLDAALLFAGASRSPEELDEAIQVLEPLRADFGGTTARFHVALAGLLRRKGDLAGAQAAFAQGTSVEPGSPIAHGALARFYLGQKDLANAEHELQQAAGSAAADATPKIALAEFYQTTGRAEEARKILVALTEQDVKSVAAWRRLAGLALEEDKLDECAQAVDKIFAAAPHDPIGLLLRGELALARRDTKAALADFTELLKLNPKFPPAGLGLARAQFLSGQIEEARATVSKVLEVAPGYDQAALLLATFNVGAGNASEAVPALEKLAAKAPSQKVYEMLSGAYLDAKRPDLAAETASKMVALAPADANAQMVLGRTLVKAGRTAEARTAFEQAAATDPGSTAAQRQLVALDFAAKQPDAALARAKGLLEAKPDSAPHLLLLGDVHASRKEFAEAEAAYSRALEINPGLGVAYVRLAAVYASSGRAEAAAAKIGEAVAKDPKNLRLTMLHGMLSQQAGDRATAIKAFERALEIRPKFVTAANNLAYLYSLEPGQEKRALELAEAAHKAAPEDGTVADTYGFALYRAGQYQAAIEPLMASASKLPDNPEVQYHLGMTYFKLGQKQLAAAALAKALEGEATFPGADEARQTLAGLN